MDQQMCSQARKLPFLQHLHRPIIKCWNWKGDVQWHLHAPREGTEHHHIVTVCVVQIVPLVQEIIFYTTTCRDVEDESAFEVHVTCCQYESLYLPCMSWMMLPDDHYQ